MSRPRLNLLIEMFAFACLSLMIATGFLLKYVLPPGSGRLVREGYGGGSGALNRPVLLLWGLTRQEWSNIHFYIAIALMAALFVHLLLHWRWVLAMVKGKSSDGSGVRVALGVMGFLLLLTLALAPFLSSVVSVPRGEILQQRQIRPSFRQGGPFWAPRGEWRQQRQHGRMAR